MNDEAVGNNGKSVIRIVTCMTMIRRYVPGFSRRCTSCCWWIWNRMAGSTQRMQWHSPMVSGRVIFTFCQISDFSGNFTLFLNFHSFSNGQKGRKPRLATFSSITCVRVDFFLQKKNWFWALRRVSILDVKTCFCGNSHTLLNRYPWIRREMSNNFIFHFKFLMRFSLQKKTLVPTQTEF